VRRADGECEHSPAQRAFRFKSPGRQNAGDAPNAVTTVANHEMTMNRREKLQEMLKASPQDPFLHYGLAMEDRRAGNLDGALAGLATAIACDPNYVAAYFHRGQILAEQQDVDGARQILRDGIAVARRVGDAHAAEEMTGLFDSL
jgi:tetratricopeptide (TPR) repeat protein